MKQAGLTPSDCCVRFAAIVAEARLPASLASAVPTQGAGQPQSHLGRPRTGET
jgi:hypothetical protein